MNCGYFVDPSQKNTMQPKMGRYSSIDDLFDTSGDIKLYKKGDIEHSIRLIFIIYNSACKELV